MILQKTLKIKQNMLEYGCMSKTPSLTEKWTFSLLADRLPASRAGSKEKTKLDLLLANPKIIKDIAELRSYFDIPQSGFKNDNLTERDKVITTWTKARLDNKKFKLFLKKRNTILEKFFVSSRWATVIDFFIFFNVKATHLLPDPIDIIIQGDTVKVFIYKDTTKKELLSIWKEITKHQDLINPFGETNKIYGTILTPTGKIGLRKEKRFYPLKDLNKYKKIIALRENGKTSKEIAREIGGTYFEINTLSRNFKRIIKNNRLY